MHACNPRVIPLLSDLTQKNFALSSENWRTLSEEVSTIFHCAADISLAKSYEELKPTNVQCLETFQRLLSEGVPKTLHYASTLSVFVGSNYKPKRILESDTLREPMTLFGGYAASKWVAEKSLLNFRKLGATNIHIYRFGLLTPERGTSIKERKDQFSEFLSYAALTHKMPKSETPLAIDVTPVDYAARCLVALAQSGGNLGVYHIANENPLLVSELSETFPSVPEEITLKEFTSEARAAKCFAALSLGLEYRTTGRRRALDLFLATDTSFDLTNTREALRDRDFSFLPPGKELCRDYIHELMSVKKSILPFPGIGRADLYDAFLFKEGEADDISNFHLFQRERYQLPASSSLLEIGCGTGRMLNHFEHEGFQVTGIEPDSEYLARAKERRSSEKILLQNSGFLELNEQERYHMITAVNGPFYYLRTPKEQLLALQNIHSALKPGGIVILDLANFLYLARHYDTSLQNESEMIIKGRRVVRKMQHDIDYEAALWVHKDRYKSEGEEYREEFCFAILTWPYLRNLLNEVGFSDLETYEGWSSREPKPVRGKRILCVAQKGNFKASKTKWCKK